VRILTYRLMSILFELIEAGHLTLIALIHKFSFTENQSAIRFLRAGEYIGKIVILDGLEARGQSSSKTFFFSLRTGFLGLPC
jgi:hypothetical protein